ncbi:MAG: O-antigen ligase [Patescibacteria group bacterium]
MRQNIQRFCRVVIFSCIYSIVALPLLVTDGVLFPFIFSKALAFQVLVEVALTCWLVLLLFIGKYTVPWRHPVLVAFFAWLAWVTAVSFFGVDFSRSLWSTPERMTGIFYYFHVFALILILSSFMREERHWRRLFLWSVVVSMTVAFGALAQKIAHFSESGYRVAATLGNPIFLAHYCLINGVLVLYLLRSEKKVMMRIFLCTALLLFSPTIILTASRAGVVTSLILLSVFLLAGSRYFVSSYARRSARWSLFAVVLAIAGFLVISQRPYIQQVIRDTSANIERVSLNTFQDDGRLRLWKEGIRIIESRPLTGWGTEVSDLLYFQRANLYPNREFELVLPDRSHNIIIDTAISTGLIGTMIFFIMWTYIGGALWRYFYSQSDRIQGIIPILLFAAYAIPLFTAFETLTSLTFFALIASFSLRPTQKDTPLANPHPFRWKSGFSVPLFVCCLIIILFFLSLNLNAFRAASSARSAYVLMISNPEEARSVFKDILRHETALSDSVRIAVAKSVEYALKNGHTPDEPQLREAVFYAIDVLEEGLRLRKDFFPFIVSLGNFYPLVSTDPDRVERGISIFEGVLKYHKNRSILYHQLARMYQVKGDLKHAREKEKKAIDLYPENGSYHWGLAVIELDSGNLAAFSDEIAKTQGNEQLFSDTSVYRTFSEKAFCGVEYDYVDSVVNQGIVQLPQDLNLRIAQIILRLNTGRAMASEYEFIKKNDPSAAKAVRDAISKHPCNLKNFPE